MPSTGISAITRHPQNGHDADTPFRSRMNRTYDRDYDSEGRSSNLFGPPIFRHQNKTANITASAWAIPVIQRSYVRLSKLKTPSAPSDERKGVHGPRHRGSTDLTLYSIN
jgi:hypothetical protein